MARATGTIRAGALVRGDLRTFLEVLRLNGLTVEVVEQKGWLDSSFALAIEGEDDQVAAAVEALRQWGRLR